ncbi:OTU domain-containing protein [Tanacetum coccineum]|uniref:OTU domain-containing protein n=1 Tax=Tanacetum coccineum TaxID=301880 RepID=A0ABQ4ZAD7_9ASTR
MDGVMSYAEAYKIVAERNHLNYQMEATYEPYDETEILNERHDYREMIGDGNCVVRSVADQFWENQELHDEVRQAGVARLIKFRELYEAVYEENPINGLSYDEYVRHIARPNVDIHPFFTQAICDAYGVRIIEMVSDANYCIAEFTPTDGEVTATIRLISSSRHTDSMYLLDD